MKKIKNVYIRAKDTEGKWGSFTLEDLVAKNQGEQIKAWFLSKVCNAIGMDPNEAVGEQHAQEMVNFLEDIGVPIYAMKED